LKANDSPIFEWPSGKCRQPRVCWRNFRTRAGFSEFLPEYIIQVERPGQLERYVSVLGTSRVQIYFLQEDQVSFRVLQEIRNRRKLQTSLDIPTYNSNGISRRGSLRLIREPARNQIIHRRNVRSLRPARDFQLTDSICQSRPFNSESCRGTVGPPNHPVGFSKGPQDMLTLSRFENT